MGNEIFEELDNHVHCRECDYAISIEEMFEAGDTCPKCGKKTSWLSDPWFFGFDEE